MNQTKYVWKNRKKGRAQEAEGRVAYWLATCAPKPKVPSLSRGASYVHRRALCSNHPANV